MKKIFLTFIILMLSLFSINAQVVNEGDPAIANIFKGQEAISDHTYSADLLLEQKLRRFNPDIFKPNAKGKYVLDFNHLKGSPYEKNTFSFGHVTDEISNKSVNLYLRYNIYNDEIELKASLQPNEKTIALLKKHDISCVINGRFYKYASFNNEKNKTKDGYLIEIYKGKNYNLYKRLTSTFTPKKIPKNSYSQIELATFDTKVTYYLQKGNSITYLSNKKKILLREFNNNFAAKNILRNKGSKLKKENDFLQFVKSLDTSVVYN